MRRIVLGRNGPEVSEICLGSMTWGTQNTEDEGHAQIDRAAERGVDFIDTAEMYPVNPISPHTTGRTEEIIGSYFARRGGRENWVIATKITGKGSSAIEHGPPISPSRLRAAVEDSLRRLRTDYIDIYQFHWPNRGSYHFRKSWDYDTTGRNREAVRADMAACLETVAALVAEGKIRHFGLSNETAWGMAEWLRLSEAGLGPRPLTLQNEYSAMCRFYDLDLAEFGTMEDITLLAYSPLAAGLLTGKYAEGIDPPPGSRRSIVSNLGGRVTPQVWPAVTAWVHLAHEVGIDPATLAIAFVLGRPFPVSPIIGATNLEQLDRALDAAGMVLTPEVLAAIDRYHRDHRMPF
ncbi:aldo/keto reductase [Phaeovulum vinaykumarii]|uniref:Predicted oxidoreductase n=1 Tax=Phaeovulum vinaykumarii TaxID=407234 RepID=A0A1N7KU99_9RHOB|nr:aldo/keto reductase [Phaeovulum vinaykumarii]SIS65183.1 Predicted oxidoreductase [Phaeovulum vinaykumarii]SOC01374.1 aryl-alcohol dehydrogenase-like predicted oxidoreductase [Phaeovulum vinaykumarii]